MNASANATSTVVPGNYDAKYAATDPLFTYVAGAVATEATGGPPGPTRAKGVGSNFGTGNGYQGTFDVYFQCSDADIDLSFNAVNIFDATYRISIDIGDGNGFRVAGATTAPRTDIQALADYSAHRVKIANGSVLSRKYRIECDNFLYFAGVDVQGTIQKYDPGGPLILVLGDSHPAGTTSPQISRFIGHAHLLKQQLGVANIRCQGQGGSGYLFTSIAGTETMRARLPNEVTNRTKPDLILDFAGANDDAQTPAAIGAEVTLFYNALGAVWPDVPVIKLSPPRRGIAGAYIITQARYDAMKNAVAADPRYGRLVFNVDGYAADFEHGTGHVGATTGNGNADTWVGPDGSHRTPDVGCPGLAPLYASGIRTVLGLSP
ncbi:MULTISPECIES: SGNH/GDSL hydrolase family protein [unclassified Bradyrhizobium]|uniref:SGNH/GDSL hydrolase family protein n=1 Tax=unclassified Bradyrhizobium TaxID=2631580 RepID=UPI0033943272